LQVALLDQIGFEHVFDRVALGRYQTQAVNFVDIAVAKINQTMAGSVQNSSARAVFVESCTAQTFPAPCREHEPIVPLPLAGEGMRERVSGKAKDAWPAACPHPRPLSRKRERGEKEATAPT
jgi:hypothetical protein